MILSGGGSLGAYQVGVLEVLERAGLKPAIVVGLSVGAINAVVWTAHGLTTGTLERTWSRLGAAQIGMRWTSLAVRLFGLFLAVLAGVEIVLTVLGSRELSVARLLWRGVSAGATPTSALFDALGWVLVGAAGYLLAHAAREIEEWISHLSVRAAGRLWSRWFGRALLAGAALHLATWLAGWPWPQRFSATVLVGGGLVWILYRRGRGGDLLRRILVRALPESGGRGLFTGLTRLRLIDHLVAAGDPHRLVDGSVHLMLNALALDSGRMCYFINWPDPGPALRETLARSLSDFEVLGTPSEVVRAAAASSAIPVLFHPVRIEGREFVDAGLFSSGALHAAIADGADALLVVLMSPAELPGRGRAERHLLEVGGWLLELGNWRDLRTELLTLPPPWSRAGDPARICVVEPREPLPARMLRFDPRDTQRLMRRGAEDAREALERAGWLEPEPARAGGPHAGVGGAPR